MITIKKLKILWQMDTDQILLFLEASFCLATARFCVRFVPLHYYIKRMGELIDSKVEKPFSKNSSHPRFQELMNIAFEIERAVNNVPWNAVCLPKAKAAKWMLNRHFIDYILFLDVEKVQVTQSERTNESTAENKTFTEIKAHAWLKAGSFFVVGQYGHQQFTVAGCFQ